MIKEDKCVNCNYYYYEDIDKGYVCVNPDSVYCTEWVDADNCCLEYEPNDRGEE